VDNEDEEEETSGARCLLVNVCFDASTDFFVTPCGFAICYLDPNVAGKRAGENSTQKISFERPADDEAILPIVILIGDMTMLSLVNAAKAGLPDPGHTIRQLWGCREEPKGVGGPHARNVTPICDNDTAGRWV